MTALSEYQRLEAAGLWRDAPGAQRVDVIVSLGESSLTIADLKERPLAHWSLPAVARANPEEFPVIYHPDGDPGETLELAEDETVMIEAIERLRRYVERRRPRPGRLRLWMFLGSMALVAALAVFWLPGAVQQHALSVVPDVKRADIGEALWARIQKVTGPACRDENGRLALSRLSARLTGPASRRLFVVRDGVEGAVHLPGRIIVLDRDLVEKQDAPDVVAGYIVAEAAQARQVDPLKDVLAYSGLWAALRLLTSGALPEETLNGYARHLLTSDHPRPEDADLLMAFEQAGVRSRPYAYAVDASGETSLGLIEADPYAQKDPPPLMSDSDWLRLQGICG